jgi:hypothetical protein
MNTEELNMTTQDVIKNLRQLMPLGPQIATLVDVAADRLEELQRQNDLTQHDHLLWKQEQEAHTECRRDLALMLEQRDEARAEVQQLTVRPEPSRLEIAAMAIQGFITSSGVIIDIPKNSLEYADKLIAAAKESK